MSVNPYQSTYHGGGMGIAPGSEEVLTPRMVRLMGSTRVWTMTLGVLMALSSVLQLLGIVLTLGQGGVFEAMIQFVMFLLFMVLPTCMLLYYSQQAARFAGYGNALDLLQAARSARTVWLVFGILTMLQLLLILSLVGMAFMAIMALR